MNEHTHDWSIRRENVHGVPDVWCECACGAVVSADNMPQILRDMTAAQARIIELEAESATWHVWEKQVRKFFDTYIGGPKIDILLAAAPDTTVANAATGGEG